MHKQAYRLSIICITILVTTFLGKGKRGTIGNEVEISIMHFIRAVLNYECNCVTRNRLGVNPAIVLTIIADYFIHRQCYNC